MGIDQADSMHGHHPMQIRGHEVGFYSRPPVYIQNQSRSGCVGGSRYDILRGVKIACRADKDLYLLQNKTDADGEYIERVVLPNAARDWLHTDSSGIYAEASGAVRSVSKKYMLHDYFLTVPPNTPNEERTVTHTSDGNDLVKYDWNGSIIWRHDISPRNPLPFSRTPITQKWFADSGVIVMQQSYFSSNDMLTLSNPRQKFDQQADYISWAYTVSKTSGMRVGYKAGVSAVGVNGNVIAKYGDKYLTNSVPWHTVSDGKTYHRDVPLPTFLSSCSQVDYSQRNTPHRQFGQYYFGLFRDRSFTSQVGTYDCWLYRFDIQTETYAWVNLQCEYQPLGQRFPIVIACEAGLFVYVPSAIDWLKASSSSLQHKTDANSAKARILHLSHNFVLINTYDVDRMGYDFKSNTITAMCYNAGKLYLSFAVENVGVIAEVDIHKQRIPSAFNSIPKPADELRVV